MLLGYEEVILSAFLYLLIIKMSAELLLLGSSALGLILLEDFMTREQVNEYFTDRLEDGEYHRIFEDLCRQPEKFQQYFRMSKQTFNYILNEITPLIRKSNRARECISPEERLMLTLR